MGVNFFSQNWTRRGGGPRASCLWTQKLPIFIFEYFPNDNEHDGSGDDDDDDEKLVNGEHFPISVSRKLLPS